MISLLGAAVTILIWSGPLVGVLVTVCARYSHTLQLLANKRDKEFDGLHRKSSSMMTVNVTVFGMKC